MLIADPIAPAAQALEIPAVIAGSVNLLGFSAALARAGDPALNRPLNP